MGNDLSASLDPEVTSIDFDAVRLGEAATLHLLGGLDGMKLGGANPSGVKASSAPPHTVLNIAHRLVPRESTQRRSYFLRALSPAPRPAKLHSPPTPWRL
ncbi:hypothetical protein GCM10022631_02190 [Deinococcus rubellus]|uniref:Uncharacterized protein n=1 Tax=Deinococcus rubellus TaxID=1889240 RepID=A0ABY5YI78_9DEIO|nr:hypothetical protein [Deinococcus rubellus]UWX64802.1 hypothetical protein N0D28_03825 [Deinococcus rubellus]